MVRFFVDELVCFVGSLPLYNAVVKIELLRPCGK